MATTTEDQREYVRVSRLAKQLDMSRQTLYTVHRSALVNLNKDPNGRPQWRFPKWYADALLAQAAPPKGVQTA